MNPKEEGRLRILHVPYSVLGFILGHWKDAKDACLPQFKGLPEDVVVEAVGPESFRHRSFQLLLSSREFDVVPEGYEVPSHGHWDDETVVFHRMSEIGFVPSSGMKPVRDGTLQITLKGTACPDCNGTKVYQGIGHQEPCRTCCGKADGE